jgi:hypothetical protein
LASLTDFGNLSLSTTQGSCPTLVEIGQPVRCTLGTIAAGASVSVVVNATPTAQLFGGTTATSVTVAILADVTADEADPVPANNRGQATLTVRDRARPNLRVVSTTVTPADARVGDIVELRAVFENVGDLSSGPVRLGLELPNGTFVSSLRCGRAGPDRATCMLPGVPAGGSSGAMARFVVGSGALPAGQTSASVIATAAVNEVGGQGLEIDLSDNRGQATLTVTAAGGPQP